MVKSTLGCLPQFYMSMFKMPETVVKKLEKIQRQFLWGDTTNKKKLHLAGWEKMTLNNKWEVWASKNSKFKTFHYSVNGGEDLEQKKSLYGQKLLELSMGLGTGIGYHFDIQISQTFLIFGATLPL